MKPELGKVAIGDHLLVIPATYARRPPEPVEAVVTKVARVWTELEEAAGEGRKRTWRMRLDTQDEGGDSHYCARFRTREQHAWEQRLMAADTCLREAGVGLGHGKPWQEPDRRIALANMIRAYDGLPEL